MWTKEVSKKTTASREQIWNLWTDVENWNKWDNEVEYSELYGSFEAGTSGILKPTNGPKSKFQLTSVDKLHSFTSRSFLPFTKMDFIHEMSEEEGSLIVTHIVSIKGPLTFLFSKVIGEKLISELPKALENLSKMAEKD
jgi:hypothetical protein